MRNMFQQSIARTRAKIGEVMRLTRTMAKQVKQERTAAATNLELLIDEICAETGIEMTPKNLPTIMLYVQQFLADQQRRRENSDEGDGGMHDFPL
jgi:hypothetical protein